MISVLCMCYNSEKYLKQVIESWSRVGNVYVYIDRKTTDNTETITRSKGLVPNFFTFTDFASSRNEILKNHQKGYRIFIDDSYILVGNPKVFVRELRSRNDQAISFRITKDHEWFTYSKITKSPVEYRGCVHEYINVNPTYQIESAYIRELTCAEHIERTLRRIPNDFEQMLNVWYTEPSNHRNVYYIARSLLFFRRHGQTVESRLIEYWLIQLLTMRQKGSYRDFALVNLRLMNSSKICA